MKTKLALLSLLFTLNLLYSQTIPFNYSIKVKGFTINNFPGLHSFVAAQHSGKWLLIGGRKDGLHARQPFNAFPAASNNTDIYVIDKTSGQLWSASVNSLPVSLKEQLQSTNMNFYQDNDTLVIIGGYGYSATAVDHITYPNLITVNISGLINAIISNSSITPYFKQITDQNFAVNGAQLGKIGDTYHLVGGHRFDGRYNPNGNPTYTQTYVNGIKKFKLNNTGTQLSYNSYTVVTDQVHLHRRDYNLVPQIFPNGEGGYTISSGVFQISVDLPFLYPVDIKSSGYIPITGFNQYLSNYHSAKVALYDSVSNTMHSIFFGGMSQYKYINNVLTADNTVPFVKTISKVSRDASGNLEESYFTNEMPSYIGSSAEFLPNHNIPHYKNEVLKLSQITADSALIGHIIGGIYTTDPSAFTNNNISATSAYSTIHEVWLVKNISTGLIHLNGNNPFSAKVFPNPAKQELKIRVNMPLAADLELFITNTEGKLIFDKHFEALAEGENIIDLTNKLPLNSGIYFFNLVCDGKYNAIEKVVINK